jgi:tetratricopeptide (TPR) repeat protein
MQYKGASVDPRIVNRELGASYVVAGSVRRSQDHLRVTAQLLDARDGRLLWSSPYDRDLTAADVFAVLDDITAEVVATIGSDTSKMWATEAEQRTDSLEAYDCVLRAALFLTKPGAEARPGVRDCLEQAVKLDPNFSRAWSTLASIYIEVYKNESHSESPGPLDLADAAAKKAIAIDQSNPEGYYALAIISQLRREDYDTFKALADKALALNPNDAGVVGDIGNFTFYSGEWERGRALLERMMKLNRTILLGALPFFLDHYRKGEYREALTEVLQVNFKHCMVQWGLAAAYGKVGETEKGKAALDQILTIDPPCPKDPRDPFVKRRLPDELVESLMDGLRKAGLEVPPTGP